MDIELEQSLRQRALRVRQDLIEMNWRAGTSHIGGSLSVVEILVVLYFHVLRVTPQDPQWEDRDRVVLSKAHCSATHYAVLAQREFFPRQRLFDSFMRVSGMLQEHADMRKTPGLEASGGSLGQGLSVACGMAWGAKHRDGSTCPVRVFAILGDGECQEGQVWEAAMAAAHMGLDNLTAVVDYNKLQVNGPVRELMSLEPLAAKWRAFGWHVQEVDGHDVSGLVQAFEKIQTAGREQDRQPHVIIAHTVKGKGISFMENNAAWHSAGLSDEQYALVLAELSLPEDP